MKLTAKALQFPRGQLRFSGEPSLWGSLGGGYQSPETLNKNYLAAVIIKWIFITRVQSGISGTTTSFWAS